MKKVTLAASADAGDNLAEWLYSQRTVHVDSIAPEASQMPPEIERMKSDARFADSQVTKLERVVELCAQCQPAGSSFLDGLFGPKRVVTRGEIDEAIDSS